VLKHARAASALSSNAWQRTYLAYPAKIFKGNAIAEWASNNCLLMLIGPENQAHTRFLSLLLGYQWVEKPLLLISTPCHTYNANDAQQYAHPSALHRSLWVLLGLSW
jgi:hypothetical protein